MAASEGVSNLADLAKAFGPMFMGSGKTTVKASADPNLMAIAQQMLQTSLANANDSTKTDATVNRILKKSSINFAPTLSMASKSGLYNSSTVSQLASEANADATAEASKAVLDYQTQQSAIAQRTLGDMLAASRQTVSSTAPSVNPLITGTLGAGMLGYSTYKNWDKISSVLGIGKDTPQGTTEAVRVPFGVGDGGLLEGGGDIASGINLADTTAAGLETFAEGGNAVSTASDMLDAGGTATEALDIGSVVDLSDGADLVSDTAAGLETFSDISDTVDLASGAGDVVSTGGDVFDMVSGAFDFGPSPLSVLSAGAHLAQGDILGAALSFIPGGNFIRKAIGGGSVVCTHLKDTGKLDARLWAVSMRSFLSYRYEGRIAYLTWAKPLLNYMRTHDNVFTRIAEKLFIARSEYLAYSQGYDFGRKNILGYFSNLGMFALCYIVGYSLKFKSFLAGNKGVIANG